MRGLVLWGAVGAWALLSYATGLNIWLTLAILVVFFSS
jgi:hypothetical protein